MFEVSVVKELCQEVLMFVEACASEWLVPVTGTD